MQRLRNNKWEDWKNEHLDLIDEEDKHMIFVAERDSFDWLRILAFNMTPVEMAKESKLLWTTIIQNT